MINQSHGHWCNFLFCRRRRRRRKWSQVRIGKKSMHNSQSLRNEIFMLGDWSHQSRGQIHNQSSTAKEYSDAKRMLTRWRRRRRRGWRRRRKRSGCYINLQKKYTQDCKKQTRTHPVLAFCPRIRVEEEEEEEEEGFVVALLEDHVGRKIAEAKLQQKLLLLWIAKFDEKKQQLLTLICRRKQVSSQGWWTCSRHRCRRRLLRLLLLPTTKKSFARQLLLHPCRSAQAAAAALDERSEGACVPLPTSPAEASLSWSLSARESIVSAECVCVCVSLSLSLCWQWGLPAASAIQRSCTSAAPHLRGSCQVLDSLAHFMKARRREEKRREEEGFLQTMIFFFFLELRMALITMILIPFDSKPYSPPP